MRCDVEIPRKNEIMNNFSCEICSKFVGWINASTIHRKAFQKADDAGLSALQNQ